MEDARISLCRTSIWSSWYSHVFPRNFTFPVIRIFALAVPEVTEVLAVTAVMAVDTALSHTQLATYKLPPPNYLSWTPPSASFPHSYPRHTHPARLRQRLLHGGCSHRLALSQAQAHYCVQQEWIQHGASGAIQRVLVRSYEYRYYICCSAYCTISAVLVSSPWTLALRP